jgi:hypothetical protein
LVSSVGAIVGRDALDGKEAGTVGFGGVEGVSANKEFVDAFPIRIFNFEVEVETKAAFDIAAELAVGVSGEGVFEVVFHHLPEFFASDFTDGDGRVVGNNIIKVVQGHIARWDWGTEAPAVGEGEVGTSGFLAGLEEEIIHG